MSASDATKANTAAKTAENNTATAPPTQKPAAQLEEDDEFEDFPVEGQHSERCVRR